MIAAMVFSDNPDEEISVNPTEVRVYWPQGKEPKYLVIVRVTEDNELQVLVAEHDEAAECLFSAVES